ncbi:MAG: virulence RhuM family protein [Selenomonas sp.]|uniref:virulence RhuM family protein n=1 Tax=Selenomonas sp. TaxID=2053611 RepID=UPI0025F9B7F4|nr:virulence RhuM family protein [Selenomonas sp.]MCI6231195.1 virulence RhuM family protein [Selenomonas sp.]
MDNIIIYNTDDGKASVKLYANDGTVWMPQAQMAELFGKDRSVITKHIKNIFAEGEVRQEGNVHFLHITNASKRTAFYSLDVILAVGFRVHSPRGTQFRRWANSTLKEYLQKGFVLDDERLKHPNGRPDYFDELLERIRDIRASEKRFYQKLRDLFALSSDYDKTDRETKQFFSETQNKLIYGVTGKTAADLIMARADHEKPNMALTSWSGSIVRKKDIIIAKNYLTEDEIDSLNRLVTIFLESAELRVKLRKDLTLSYWRGAVDKLLNDHDIPVLVNHGNHSHKEMEAFVEAEYDVFDERRKRQEALDADADDLAELERDAERIESQKS